MSKIIAICNQKDGTGKTVTAVNLAAGLAWHGEKVLLVDIDAQGDATACLGWNYHDSMELTIATIMQKIMNGQPVANGEGILHHNEGIDLIPSNIELSSDGLRRS